MRKSVSKQVVKVKAEGKRSQLPVLIAKLGTYLSLKSQNEYGSSDYNPKLELMFLKRQFEGLAKENLIGRRPVEKPRLTLAMRKSDCNGPDDTGKRLLNVEVEYVQLFHKGIIHGQRLLHYFAGMLFRRVNIPIKVQSSDDVLESKFILRGGAVNHVRDHEARPIEARVSNPVTARSERMVPLVMMNTFLCTNWHRAIKSAVLRHSRPKIICPGIHPK